LNRDINDLLLLLLSPNDNCSGLWHFLRRTLIDETPASVLSTDNYLDSSNSTMVIFL